MLHIDVYSDIICPWCYIGEHRLHQAIEAMPEITTQIIMRPFQLDPTAVAPMPVIEYLQRKFGPRAGAALRSVAVTAHGEGLAFEPKTQIVVNTLPAHRVLQLALAEHGAEVQVDLMRRLFRTHFAEGANVADSAVLAEVGAAAGMIGARIRELLAGDEGLGEVESQIVAAQELGVRAVPTFVFGGRYALQGAQAQRSERREQPQQALNMRGRGRAHRVVPAQQVERCIGCTMRRRAVRAAKSSRW